MHHLYTMILVPGEHAVEPPNKGHFGANSSFVPCREVVPISEVE